MKGYFTGTSGGVSNSRITYEVLKDAASQFVGGMYRSIKGNPFKAGSTLLGLLAITEATGASIAAADEFTKPQAAYTGTVQNPKIGSDAKKLAGIVMKNPDREYKQKKMKDGTTPTKFHFMVYEKTVEFIDGKLKVVVYDDNSEPNYERMETKSADGILGLNDHLNIYDLRGKGRRLIFRDVHLDGFTGTTPADMASGTFIGSSLPPGGLESIQWQYKETIEAILEVLEDNATPNDKQG